MTECVLWIAEKDSLIFQAILPVLPGENDEATKFYARRGNQHFISLNGHALEQALPDAYLDESVPTNSKGAKVWRREDIPVIPTEWQMVEKEKKMARLQKLKQLLKVCTVIHHVGDPEPEGQLIVDEVLDYFGNRKPVLRVLINDYNATKVKEALANIRSNNEPMFRSWSQWALARSRYDWLVGLNATRAMTIRARSLGHDVTLPIGSVQTVVQWIVVENDKRIESFIPTAYFKLTARFTHADGQLVARWKAGAGQAGMTDGKLVDKAEASKLVEKVSGQPGIVSLFDAEAKSSRPPLTMGLDELQMEAFSRFGYSSKETAAAAQKLYEIYQVTTYPRSDNRYLSEESHIAAGPVIDRIFEIRPDLLNLKNLVDPSRKSPAFDDKKMFNAKGEPTPHHAIIPTQAEITVDTTAWSEQERNIYDLVVRTYLAQFAADYEYLQTDVTITVAEESFVASGTTTSAEGWQRVLSPAKDPDAETDPVAEQALPAMAAGDPIVVDGVDLNDAKTSPPARFDESRLLAAMKSVHKYVDDAALAARLRESDGIGTTATRSAMLTEMLSREVLVPIKVGSSKLQAAAKTRSLIEVLPADVKSAAQAGTFRLKLDQVASGDMTMQQFMDETVEYVHRIVKLADEAPFELKHSPAALKACPKCQGEMHVSIKLAECKDCQLRIWREVAGKALSDTDFTAVLAGKTTREISGFTSKKATAKSKFSARLKLDTATWKITFVFDETQSKNGSTTPSAIDEPCPSCQGALERKGGAIACQAQCGFKLWVEIASRPLTADEIHTLLTDHKVGPLTGFLNREKKKFTATLTLDTATGRTNFEFPPRT
jgi:DNA topoisomerase-3